MRHGLSALVLCTLIGLGQEIASQAQTQALPNLRPYQLESWPAQLVVHTNAFNASQSDVALDIDELFVDWATLNNSNTDITNQFYVTIRVDGQLKLTHFSRGLAAQQYTWIWYDQGHIGKLTNSGFHTVRVEFDATGVIAESDETDNVIERQIIISSTNHVPSRLFAPRYLDPQSFSCDFLGSAGRRYQVEYSTNLMSWHPLRVVTNSSGVSRFFDTNPAHAYRSYRLRILTP